MMNELGTELIADDKFTTSDTKYYLQTVELTVRRLAFPDGATTRQIFERASELDLDLCPLELGPHLRLFILISLKVIWEIIFSNIELQWAPSQLHPIS